MKKDTLISFSKAAINFTYNALFFLTPLFFTPYNYELFEFNKMFLVYFATALIATGFIIKSIAEGKIAISRTPFDIPLLAFLISQIISTIFSIDTHVSLFGYYSRFHGGLVSTICYIILFYVFVTLYKNESRSYFNILRSTIISSIFVALYAIGQRLGIDKHIWIQDVQNRVFSTLGQPNWLAAYFSIVILLILPLINVSKNILKKLAFTLLAGVGYLVILFTRSRSGFAGFWTGLCIYTIFLVPKYTLILSTLLFFTLTYLNYARILTLLPAFGDATTYLLAGVTIINLVLFLLVAKKSASQTTVIKTLSRYWIILLFITITYVFGSPFSQLEKYTLKSLFSTANTQEVAPSQKEPETAPLGSSVIDIGITESGNIRKIVWQGAVDIIKKYPIKGSGVETFAFSYYGVRPPEHNLTSEWDYLYNKAHNEYLNIAANTGLLGIISYFAVIITFLYKATQSAISSKDKALTASFIAAYISILISNFFGFSVVVIGLFFFMIPAFYLITQNAPDTKELILTLYKNKQNSLNASQTITLALLATLTIFILYRIIISWVSDTHYNTGSQYTKAGQYAVAYTELKTAVTMNPYEPTFKDELASVEAVLSSLALQENKVDVAEALKNESLQLSEEIVTKYPHNINFWKTRTRVLYVFGEQNPNYFEGALDAINTAWTLAPNDAKIAYNAGLIYAKIGQNNQAITALIKASELKPDYYEPHYALALFYEQLGEKEKAIQEINYILENIRPDDQTAQEKLKSLEQ